jgi:hypothetical protein
LNGTRPGVNSSPAAFALNGTNCAIG